MIQTATSHLDFLVLIKPFLITFSDGYDLKKKIPWKYQPPWPFLCFHWVFFFYYIFWWLYFKEKQVLEKFCYILIFVGEKWCNFHQLISAVCWSTSLFIHFFFAFSAISYNSSQFLKLVNEIDLSMCTLYRFHSNTQVSFKHPFFVHCGVFNSLNQFLINSLRSQNQINLIEYWIKIAS